MAVAFQFPLKRLASRICPTSRAGAASATALHSPRRCFTVLHASRAAKDLKSRRKAEEGSAHGNSSGNGKTASELIPGSQRIAAGEEYTKAEGKMKASVEYFRREAATLDMRASGRVTPAILAPVRVRVREQHGEGESEGESGKGARLEEVATVGVKEGTTLLVTVFEEHMLKPVHDALYDAKIPGVVPQKVDERTIRIPLPKPTVEARLELFAVAKKQGEDTRVLIRKQHDTSVRKGKYAKRSPELEEFRTLQDKYIKEVDTILAGIKKNTGAK